MTWEVSVTLRMGPSTLDATLRGDGRPVALVGPNGAGKSTLLRAIAGAHRPTSGRIEIDGLTVFDAANGIHLPPEARKLGYVPQGFGLFPHLRVVDNIAFGQRGIPRSRRRHAAQAHLAAMGSSHLAQRWPRHLSGGEKQRVALARALLAAPRMLLLDEPLSALDAVARRTMRTYLAQYLADQNIPALVVTHDVRDVLALDARVYVLEAGTVVQSGTATELAAKPATPFVAEFFHRPVV